MAIASALITGDDNNNHINNYPTLFGMVPFSSAEWTTDGAGGADITDSDYPAVASFDNHMANNTRPTPTAQVRWFEGTLNTSFSSVDCLFLHVPAQGHASTTITVYLSDGSTDVEITNVDTDYFQTGVRMFMPLLQISGDTGTDQRRFTGVTLVKVKFDAGGGNTGIPQVAECAVGLQSQMYAPPMYPDGDNDDAGNISVFSSQTGVQTSYSFVHGMKRLTNGLFFPDSDASQQLLDWRQYTGYGRWPFVYCPNPSSAPNTAWVMRQDDPGSFEFPLLGPNHREYILNATEQGGSLLVDE
jgi:hypothetical protein